MAGLRPSTTNDQPETTNETVPEGFPFDPTPNKKG